MSLKELKLNDIIIESRSSDNYINATQLCKAGCKQFKDWYRLESTKELIKELEKNLKSDGHILPSQITKLIDVKRGNSKKFSQGSWIHPDLAVQLAQWISPKFAIQVSRWVRELMLTGAVVINSKKSDQELLWLQNELLNKNNLLKEKDAQLNRLHNIQAELLSYKKRITKNESIYIASTANYARQGIFKVGRTKTAIQIRNSGHNNTHITGDKFKIIKEFKVNDAAMVERRIHLKLSGLLVEKEFFMCPYNLLESLTDIIINNDDDENNLVNGIVDAVYKLKQAAFNSSDWMAGIPTDVFEEKLELKEDDVALATFNITGWSSQDKKDFVEKCMHQYISQQNKNNKNINKQQILWKTFQEFLLIALALPKSRFKVAEWKPVVKEALENNTQLSIKWRV